MSYLHSLLEKLDQLSYEDTKRVYQHTKKRLKLFSQDELNKNLKQKNDIVDEKGTNHYRKIAIIVRGHQYYREPGRPGSYEYILFDMNTGDYRVKLSGKMEGQTQNRALIMGIIDAMKKISQEDACHIEIITKTNFGFFKMSKKDKGVNSDLLEELATIITDRSFLVTYKIDTKYVDKCFVEARNKKQILAV